MALSMTRGKNQILYNYLPSVLSSFLRLPLSLVLRKF